MGLNFYYYDGLQPKMRAAIINEHECTSNINLYLNEFVVNVLCGNIGSKKSASILRKINEVIIKPYIQTQSHKVNYII